MGQPRRPRSGWGDGAFYAATVDRLLTGVRGYIADHLPEGDRVLDACCGTGALSRRLAREGRDVVGVDLSPKHIAYARKATADAGLGQGRARFELADVAQLAPPDEGPYDVAVIAFALHEMPTAARPEVVDALVRVAHRVMVVDFVAPMPWNLAGLRNRAAEVAAGPDHFRSFLDYSRNGGLAALIRRDGVDIEHERTIDAGTLHVVTLAPA